MKKIMKVFVVYCHPSADSFTKHMCDAFIKGITDSGNEYILSDLYKMDFDPTMTEQEYFGTHTTERRRMCLKMCLQSRKK